MRKISKILSANDTGETGAHQAGILVPKEKEVLSFFPELDKTVKNPRVHLSFEDESGKMWEFAFIYYNGKFFDGTRNEYRLTRMTKYIKSEGLSPEDEVILEKDDAGNYKVKSARKNMVKTTTAGALILSGGWKVIDIRR